MKKHTTGGLYLAVLLAASFLTAPLTASAQANNASDKAKPAEAATKAPRPYPFSGKLGAVDKEKKTITIIGKERSRTLHLNDETKIQKLGKPATLEDAAVGEEVAGQLRKTDDGKETLVSLRIGPKVEEVKAPKEKPVKPAK
jgi:hypothetical protein